MPVERLHRGVDVEDPVLLQQRLVALAQMPPQPLPAGRLLDAAEGPPHAVFADHLAHPQKLRVDAVVADRVDVGVALVAGQHA
jgi:hypothetical protein